MASTLIQTVTDPAPLSHQGAVGKVGGRTWATWFNGTNVVIRYSDDDGATWSSEIILHAGGLYPALWCGTNPADGTTHVHVAYAGGNSLSDGLYHRALHGTKATTGAVVAGDFSTEIQVESGLGTLGVYRIGAWGTETATNPRFFVGGGKQTASGGTREARIWYAPVGTAADSAANWKTLTNVASSSDSASQKAPLGVHVKIGGQERMVVVVPDPGATPARFKSLVFDPTATTITPGAATTALMALSSGGFDDWLAQGVQAKISAFYDDGAGNGVAWFSRRNPATGNVDVYYSTNGTTWTLVTNGSFTAGRHSHGVDDAGDAHLVYSTSYGVAATTDQPLERRKLTRATQTLDAAGTAYGENGNGVAVAPKTGASNLTFVFRQDTASPYDLRSDHVVISVPSNWTAGPDGATAGLRLAGQMLASGGAAGASWYNAASYGPEVFVYAQIPQVPPPGDAIGLWARLQNPGNPATFETYELVWTPGSGFGYWKHTAAGGWAQIGSTVADVALANYDWWGFAARGTTLTGYVKQGVGAWVPLLPVSDSSISAAGRVAVQLNGTVVRLDNFGAGTLSKRRFRRLTLVGAG